MEANLRQYGLEHRYVDMLVADAASSIWRQKEIFDAIVTDRKLSLLPSLCTLFYVWLASNFFYLSQLPMVSERVAEKLAPEKKLLPLYLRNCEYIYSSFNDLFPKCYHVAGERATFRPPVTTNCLSYSPTW